MKIIVVSGSYSNIGKTTLVRNIRETLRNCHVETVKFGHNSLKPEKQEKLFNDMDEGIAYIKELKTDFLIIESNSIYNFIRPDLGIFLENSLKLEKQTAKLAKQYADIIVNKEFDYEKAKIIVKNKIGTDCIVPAILQQYSHMHRVE